MAENRAGGPFMGQMAVYTETSSVFYPALIISVDATTGKVRLTTFPAGGTTADQQAVPYDGTGVISGTWRYPDSITGL